MTTNYVRGADKWTQLQRGHIWWRDTVGRNHLLANEPAGTRPTPKAIRLLAALGEAADRGLTHLECASHVGFRYGARIAELRRFGINIDTIPEGSHRFRYRLAAWTPPEDDAS